MKNTADKKVIAIIAGARPNFIKIAPILREITNVNRISPILIHTGQHFDHEMSSLFFKDLNLEQADFFLNINNKSHSVMTGKIMAEVEKICIKIMPDLIMVVGDVDSTLAAALAASKLHIPVAHVEAGLRSNDRLMPEEINRIITDRLSDFLFIHSSDAAENLISEGISEKKIFFVGNVMIDSLKKLKRISKGYNSILKKYNLKKKQYALLTLHRPSNVDNRATLKKLLLIFSYLSKRIPIIFPIHPRTRRRISEFGLRNILHSSKIILTPPIGYLENLNLLTNAKFVLTDSGGIQEETTYLNVPCLTLRDNTERPITVTQGTNRIVGTDRRKITSEFEKIMSNRSKNTTIPKYWDGHASKRIVRILTKTLLT